MYRRIRQRIRAIFILCGCILIGIIYLSIFHIVKNNKNEDISIVVEETPEPTIVIDPTIESTILPTETPEIIEVEDPVDITSDNSITRLISTTFPIDKTYVPSDLIEINVIRKNGTPKLREEATNALEEMIQASEEAGLKVRVLSAYRSYAEQESLYSYYYNTYGEEWASEIDDHPGASEHQLGLAVDLTQEYSNCDLQACFADTEVYAWLSKHAYEYGFIERYPEEKKEVTGIIYSSWHYRYVGKEEAKKLYESQLTMEEYYLD